MIAKNAWNLINSVMVQTEKQYNISVQNTDDIYFDYGIIDDSKIEFPSYGLEKSSHMNPSAEINENFLFSALCSLGHEISHQYDKQNLQNISFERKLFYCIDDNLPNYYLYNKRSENSFYYNDYNEINAEENGLNLAYVLIAKEIGQENAKNLLKTYVNEKTKEGIYYIPRKQYKTYDEIINAFERKKLNTLCFNFPFPFSEPICDPIKEEYASITHGINQLGIIAGRTFTAHNYEQKSVMTQYNHDFWNKIKNICDKYPQFNPYVKISLQNNYDMTVDSDLAEIGININELSNSYDFEETKS